MLTSLGGETRTLGRTGVFGKSYVMLPSALRWPSSPAISMFTSSSTSGGGGGGGAGVTGRSDACLDGGLTCACTISTATGFFSCLPWADVGLRSWWRADLVEDVCAFSFPRKGTALVFMSLSD